MPPPSPVYRSALDVLGRALARLTRGEYADAETLLAGIDPAPFAAERLAVARFLEDAADGGLADIARSPRPRIREADKRAVAARDRWHCRYTGRPLVHPTVFRELGRVTVSFPYDEHHGVRRTTRGDGGHPMVRTHAAAYDHVVPLACGGPHAVANLVLTSVELNERKGDRQLRPLAPLARAASFVPAGWAGFTEYLPALRSLPTIGGRPPTTATRPTIPAPERTAVPPRQGGPGAAFDVFWAGLESDFRAGVPLLFGPRTGNPRRVVEVTVTGMTLREDAARAGISQVARATLRREFEALIADPGWRQLATREIRLRHGIANWAEFKRALFERFERGMQRERPDADGPVEL